jgi:hypothetical protein
LGKKSTKGILEVEDLRLEIGRGKFALAEMKEKAEAWRSQISNSKFQMGIAR